MEGKIISTQISFFQDDLQTTPIEVKSIFVPKNSASNDQVIVDDCARYNFNRSKFGQIDQSK